MFARARAAALVAISILAGQLGYGAEKPIIIGVVIDGSNHEDRAPLVAYLTKAMGRPVMVDAPDAYSETVAALADGLYDFACVGALVYIRAHAKYGVIPLVQRSTDLEYHTIFITGTGSPIYSLNDLRGKQFAFGDVGSTSGRLMPYVELKRAGIDPETDLRYRYSGSHLATAALVSDGAVDAGAIDKTVFDFLISNGQLDGKKIRIFYTSKPYVDYVWVARKGVPEAERRRFAQALLALKEGRDDRVLKVLRAREFVVANDAEYAATRRIDRELGRTVHDPHIVGDN